MPLYEYQCEACHHRFEKIQKYSDPLEDKCPKCAGKVRKLLSSPAIQFKGSGWYITDYAKKSSSEASKAGSAKGESAKGESTSSDSKSDSGTATDSKPSTDAAAKKD